MSQDLHRRENAQTSGGRSWSRIAIIFLLILCAGSLAVFVRKGHPPKAPLTTQTSAQPDAALEPTPGIPTVSPQPSNSIPASASPSVTRPPPSLATTTLTEPTAQSRALVASLTRLDQSSSPTAEQATEWKTNLLQLVQQGATGVAGIREFLGKSVDMDFGPNGRQMLGYTSARAAMFDALQQIGGPEAVSAMTSVLQTTADPKEIALLAKNLAQHGGAEAVSQLQQAGKQWNYYAAIALAQLPEGAGIPALIQIARDGTFANTTALEMVTQAAPQYPEARAALVEMARASRIAPSQWPYLTSLLAGDQFHYQDSAFDASNNRTPEGAAHVLFGNQHFFTAPPEGGLTPEQISQQTALIDELLDLTSEPAAANALKEAKELLSKRPPQTAAVGK